MTYLTMIGSALKQMFVSRYEIRAKSMASGVCGAGKKNLGRCRTFRNNGAVALIASIHQIYSMLQ